MKHGINRFIALKMTGLRPVGCEDVKRRWLLAGLKGFLQWDGQRLSVKQLLILNGRTPESLPHGNILKRH